MKSAFCMWALPVWECQKAVKEPPPQTGHFSKKGLALQMFANKNYQVCGLVAFCDDPEHKRLHRPEQFCFPFMVEKREGVGRLVSKRDHIFGGQVLNGSLYMNGFKIDLTHYLILINPVP